MPLLARSAVLVRYRQAVIPPWVMVVLSLVCFALALLGKERVLGRSGGSGWRVLLSNGKTDAPPDTAWRVIYVVVGLALLAFAWRG